MKAHKIHFSDLLWLTFFILEENVLKLVESLRLNIKISTLNNYFKVKMVTLAISRILIFSLAGNSGLSSPPLPSPPLASYQKMIWRKVGNDWLMKKKVT